MGRGTWAVMIFALGAAAGGALGYAGQAGPGAETTAAVTGIGGVFLKAEDPDELRGWYRRHLGIDAGPTGASFFWRDRSDPESLGRTVWSIFPEDTEYFGETKQQCMVNYRVADLDALLARLAEHGVEQVGELEEYEYGRFAWILDGEGNRVELWEPPDLPPEP